MRNFLLVLMLAVSSSGAQAQWVEVYPYEEDFTNHVDASTIDRTGDKVKMWSMVNRKLPSDKYMSFKYLVEYDCKTTQYRWLETSFHSGKMGVGKASHPDPSRRSWKQIRRGSGTIFETMWMFACGQ